LVPVAAVPGTKLVQVYVATTRTRQAPDENAFTNDRAPALNFARYTISVPPGHTPSKIEWPNGKPDPLVNFATVDQAGLTAATFRGEIAALRTAVAATGSRAGKGNVIVFVHGYNENFQEALFRLATLAADSDIPAAPVLFSWPSLGALSGYVADKDSVTYSRDYLVETLAMLAADPRIGKITVLGHSMGGWLTAEALRQLRLTRQDRVLARLEVVLAAPDIDVDVFRSQVRVIGPMTPPMTLLVSKDDRALAVSSFITTERPRVGALDVENPLVREAALKADIRIIDISNLPSSDRFNHSRFVGLAALYPKVSHDANRNLGNAGAFVFDAVGATVAAPFRIGSKVLGN
jgi:esterase/lipase superfamily enzyme